LWVFHLFPIKLLLFFYLLKEPLFSSSSLFNKKSFNFRFLFLLPSKRNWIGILFDKSPVNALARQRAYLGQGSAKRRRREFQKGEDT